MFGGSGWRGIRKMRGKLLPHTLTPRERDRVRVSGLTDGLMPQGTWRLELRVEYNFGFSLM